MDRIGVRDLKQYASRVLARVKAGETVEVTEHGTPVAVLVPAGALREYAMLFAAGEILPGAQGVADVEPVHVAGSARLSDEVGALRDEDWR